MASKFFSYFLNNSRSLLKLFFMLSAKWRTDLLLFSEIFLKTPSAFKRISIVKSSLPFPLSTLATF
jgi:hypothetical protein